MYSAILFQAVLRLNESIVIFNSQSWKGLFLNTLYY